MGVASDPTPFKAAAIAAVKVLMAAVADPVIVQAAWRDLGKACEPCTSTAQTTAQTIALRRDLFLLLARRSGRNVEDLCRALAGVLADEPVAVYAARVAVGDQEPVGSGLSHLTVGALAGLKVTQQRDLCLRLLALPLRTGGHVVWLAFERARLRTGVLRAERVIFFDSERIPATPEAVTAAYTSLVPELSEEDATVMAEELPHAKGVVLARVDLPAGIYSDPVAVAADQVDALVTVATFHSGHITEDHWRLMSGYSHLSARGSAWQRFTRPSDRLGAGSGRVHDEIAVNAASVLSRLSAAEESVAQALEILRWWRRAREQSSPAGVILNVRVLELLGARLHAPAWERYVRDYLRAAWITNAMREEVTNTVLRAVGAGSDGLPEQEWKRLKVLRGQVLEIDDDRWRALLVAGSSRTALAELVSIYPLHHPQGRRVHTLAARLHDRASVITWQDELGQRWICLLSRLARIRNAITHGGPVTVAAADTVFGFSDQLAGQGVSLALKAAMDGSPLAATHAAFRATSDGLFNDLCTVGDPASLLHT